MDGAKRGSRAASRRLFPHRLSGVAALGLACLMGLPLRSADSSTPIEVYGRLPTLEDLALSPDGTEAAFVSTKGDTRNLYIVRIADARPLGGARVGDIKLRYIEWVDNDNLLTAVSSTSLPPVGFWGSKREWFQLIDYNIPKRRLQPIDFHVSDVRTFNVAAGKPMVRDVKGEALVFVPGLYLTNEVLPALFSYDPSSSRMRLIRKGSERFTEWMVDDVGHVAGRFVYRDQRKDWDLMLETDGGKRIVSAGKAALDVPLVLGFDASGASILMEFWENGRWVWRPVLLKDGSLGEPLEGGDTFQRAIQDRKTGRVLGGVTSSDEGRYVFFDNELQAHWNAALRAFPDERVDLLSNSDDFSRLLVRVFGAKDGYVYALFDWYSHQTRVVGKVYDGLTTVASVKRIQYPAADGLTIPAILTLPAGRAPTDLPLIVLPHGGPAVEDSTRFDWWAQALADQGYAVLQPNYRGSTVSERHHIAGYGEWGRKMQTDLSDGVRYLAHAGTIDPKRVCIVGGSYGGYAALAGVTLDPGVYRCAVSVAGLSDLKRFLKWTNEEVGRSDNFRQRYWDRFMGASSPDDPALAPISPIEHIDAVTVPLLLIHGKDDTVVPYEQSEVMERALKRAGKPVQLVTLDHEDHWLSRSATRLQMLQATVAFLKANDPPD